MDKILVQGVLEIKNTKKANKKKKEENKYKETLKFSNSL